MGRYTLLLSPCTALLEASVLLLDARSPLGLALQHLQDCRFAPTHIALALCATWIFVSADIERRAYAELLKR